MKTKDKELTRVTEIKVRPLVEFNLLKNKQKQKQKHRRCKWLMLQSFDPFPQGSASIFHETSQVPSFDRQTISGVIVGKKNYNNNNNNYNDSNNEKCK